MGRREAIEMEEKEKRGFPIGIIVLIILLAITIAAFFGVYYYYNSSLEAVNSNNKELTQITIEAGSGVEGISKVLKSNNLIKDELVFKVYCKLNSVTNMQAGEYELSQSMSVKEITEELQNGNVIVKEIKVMFPEGKNMRGIADIIASNTNHTKEEVMEIFESKEFAKELVDSGKYWFLTDEILDDDIYYPLEGYLYPDTYIFESKDVKIETIINIMMNKMEKVLDEYRPEIEATNLTVHQFLSLASVVENEGVSKVDRQGIARVFLNRIDKKMALQSDVTTYYAFKINMGDRDLTKTELNTFNKYNTRGPNMEGKLPIGPISSISEESIEATCNPDESDYLFFVADKNKKVYFSSTNAEHEQIISELKEQGLWYNY